MSQYKASPNPSQTPLQKAQIAVQQGVCWQTWRCVDGVAEARHPDDTGQDRNGAKHGSCDLKIALSHTFLGRRLIPLAVGL